MCYWMLLRTCDLNPAGYHGLARFLHVANTALIYFILRRLVTSRAGAAVGAMLFASQALFSLTNGAWNTALGLQALYYNTSGSYNTAVGVRALFNNTTVGGNTATGVYALFSSAGGSDASSLYTNERAGHANPEGERTTGNAEPCTANPSEQPVKLGETAFALDLATGDTDALTEELMSMRQQHLFYTGWIGSSR